MGESDSSRLADSGTCPIPFKNVKLVSHHIVSMEAIRKSLLQHLHQKLLKLNHIWMAVVIAKIKTCPSYKEALNVCKKFGKLCVAHLDAHGVNPLLSHRQARHLQSHLCLLKLASQTQVKSTDMWGPSQNSMNVDN